MFLSQAISDVPLFPWATGCTKNIFWLSQSCWNAIFYFSVVYPILKLYRIVFYTKIPENWNLLLDILVQWDIFWVYLTFYWVEYGIVFLVPSVRSLSRAEGARVSFLIGGACWNENAASNQSFLADFNRQFSAGLGAMSYIRKDKLGKIGMGRAKRVFLGKIVYPIRSWR